MPPAGGAGRYGIRPCIIARVESSIAPLLPLFERERSAGRPVVLGVLLHTAGSTYRRPGALLLIAASGEYAGLLAGGCLEGDLAQHAQEVLDSGRARLIGYDLRNPDDLIWGMGAGCEGAMRILLLRVGPEEHWQPLVTLAGALAAHEPAAVGIVAESALPAIPPGTLILTDAETVEVLPASARARLLQPELAEAVRAARQASAPGWLEIPGCRVLLLPLALPPRLLLLGGGPDAQPVADFAARLHWKVTVADHRPRYALPARFPGAERVILVRPEALSEEVELARFTAAVVMSHHLPTDLQYLRALCVNAPPYIGLLGPPARREKLLAELGTEAVRLRERLRAPVGLNLGGRSPEAIALAIVAEILAFVHKPLE